MKWFTVLLIVVVVGLAAAKGGWKKKKWQHKKHQALLKKHNINENNVDYKEKDGNPTEYGEDKTKSKTFKLTHLYGRKMSKANKKKGGWKKNKKARKERKMTKKMAWLNIRTDFDCELKCKEGEVCVSGPMVTKPFCMSKIDLKKSLKTFHRAHKKEKKAWRKFQKQHNKSADWKKLTKEEKLKMLKEEKYNKLGKGKGEKMEEGEKEVEEDKEQKKNKKKEGKMESHRYNKKHHHGKKGKRHHKLHPKVSDPSECGPSRMKQMQTRLMGWFHLLHGQDQQARKEHGGKIGNFHKHVSMKKELREMDGDKCQCFKSALWQFHQMDKDQDDHLTEQETTYLRENSLEPCLKPYLQTCDRDQDSKISSDEWCCCFAHVVPPCFKQLREIKKSGESVSYLPRCDKEGYFNLEQCKGDKLDNSLTCWCVDQNGNEFKDTVVKGRAHCDQIEKYSHKQAVPLF